MLKKHKRPAISLIFILISLGALLLIPQKSIGVDMFGWLKREEVILSSPVKGKLLDGDKPLSNVTITRELTYGKEYTDKTVTDQNGNFSFPEKIIKSSKPGNMFDNDVLRQHIYTNISGEQNHLWMVRVYRGKANNQALTQNLENLVCDIQHEPQTNYVPIKDNEDSTFTIYSNCKIQ